jgi:hypothetical protein
LCLYIFKELEEGFMIEPAKKSWQFSQGSLVENCVWDKVLSTKPSYSIYWNLDQMYIYILLKPWQGIKKIQGQGFKVLN